MRYVLKTLADLTWMFVITAWLVVYGPDTARLVIALYKVAAGVYQWGGLL